MDVIGTCSFFYDFFLRPVTGFIEMPKYLISWKAELANVTNIGPSNPEDFEWTFKVVCTKCREHHEEAVYFKQSELHENINSRGESNLIMKCKFCGSIGTMDVVAKSTKYLDIEKQGFQPLVVIEGRGWEPSEWIPTGGFKAESLAGTVFDEIDLHEKEWCDYDEASSESVEIMAVESKVTKA
jgi:hypothetical protein